MFEELLSTGNAAIIDCAMCVFSTLLGLSTLSATQQIIISRIPPQ